MRFSLKRAILISAGRGSRLGEITNDLPKCLVSVAGKPILDHQLEALWRNGIEDVFVVAGFQHEAIARRLAAIGESRRPKLILNPFWSVSSSIGSVWAAREFLDEPFCLINGDTIFDAPLFGSALARAGGGISLLVDKGPLELDDMRVEVDGDRIVAVSKALPNDANLLRSLGMIVSAEPGGGYRGALERIIAQPQGHLSYHHDIIDMLAKEEVVRAVRVDSGHWREIDLPEDIRKYEEFAARLEKAG